MSEPLNPNQGNRASKESPVIEDACARSMQKLDPLPTKERLNLHAMKREEIRRYHDDEGHTWAETAEHFGLRVDTVRKRVYRARRDKGTHVPRTQNKKPPSVYARHDRGNYTAREFAEVMGVSVRTVYRWTSQPREKWLNERAMKREEIRRYHDDEGHTWAETAEHFGLSAYTAREQAYLARAEREAELEQG